MAKGKWLAAMLMLGAATGGQAQVPVTPYPGVYGWPPGFPYDSYTDAPFYYGYPYSPCYPFASCWAYRQFQTFEQRRLRSQSLGEPPPAAPQLPDPRAAWKNSRAPNQPLSQSAESELQPDYRDTGKILPEFDNSGELRPEFRPKEADAVTR